MKLNDSFYLKKSLDCHGTITLVDQMSDYSTAIDNKESKENYKVRVEGYFEDGRRKGFCTVTTNDIEVKGWYNKKGVLEGFGTVRYLPNGKYKFSIIVTCSKLQSLNQKIFAIQVLLF